MLGLHYRKAGRGRMTINWIVDRLKVSGRGTKQEVLNALENATSEELKELSANLLGTAIAMKMCGVKKYSDMPQPNKSDAEV